MLGSSSRTSRLPPSRRSSHDCTSSRLIMKNLPAAARAAPTGPADAPQNLSVPPTRPYVARSPETSSSHSGGSRAVPTWRRELDLIMPLGKHPFGEVETLLQLA